MDVRSLFFFLLVLATSVAAPLGFPAEVQEFHEAMTKNADNKTAAVAEEVIGAGAAGGLNITTDADGDIHVNSGSGTPSTVIIIAVCVLLLIVCCCCRARLEDLEDRRMRLIAADAKIDRLESDLLRARVEADNAKLARNSTKACHVKELEKMKKRRDELVAEKAKKAPSAAAEPGLSTSAAAPPAATGDSTGLFQDMLINFKEFVDNHLSCIICSEILVFPSTVVVCGHTFCNMCIEKWNKKSNDCPICRSRIDDIIPNVALESYLEKVAETFFPEDAKSARKVLHEQRAA